MLYGLLQTCDNHLVEFYKLKHFLYVLVSWRVPDQNPTALLFVRSFKSLGRHQNTKYLVGADIFFEEIIMTQMTIFDLVLKLESKSVEPAASYLFNLHVLGISFMERIPLLWKSVVIALNSNTHHLSPPSCVRRRSCKCFGT